MRPTSRRFPLALAVALGLATQLAGATSAGPIAPDPGFALKQIPDGSCTPENAYEAHTWAEGAYGSHCKRIHFAFGPIYVKAGQMDGVIQPVTIEKPAYAGSIVRFKPDLKNPDGTVPDIADVHLHHGTWLNGYPQYGNGPFFAAGEEKTILDFPAGYGMPVKPTDTWLLLYMVHNQTPQPRVEWITYDIDFVAAADATTLGIQDAKPIWLDVQHTPIAPGAPDRSSYPVFNAQRGFGTPDPVTGRMECAWPKQNCARFDSFGFVTPQQGKPVSVAGADWTVPAGMGGSLIGLGGHIHPGGVRDEVSLVRSGVEKRIFNSEAVAWRHDDHTAAGGPLTSWDFSMTVTGTPLDWKVNIKPGDVIRLNAVYDTQDESWYENMGIVVAFVVPNDRQAPKAADVFDDQVNLVDGVPMGAISPPGFAQPSCTPDLVSAVKTLCLRGEVTHGHLAEATNYGGCPPTGCGVVDAKPGPVVDNITATGFTYGIADQGVVGIRGIPRLKIGVPAHFYNSDSTADIWHTFTLCAESVDPACTGATGISYPLAGGGTGSPQDLMDFDSTELGIGGFYSSARGQVPGTGFPTQTVQEGTEWTFTPTRAGTYQFFCRVHPSMRGVFEVTP